MAPDGPDPVTRNRPTRPGHRLRMTPRAARDVIGVVETGLYLVVGLLLAVAGGVILYGTVSDLVHSFDGDRSEVAIGLRVLDRVLLLLIVAELLYTLQLVVVRGEIFVEPFLFIGLIAVVRRVVVITAEVENLPGGGRELTNFLLELGILAVLALGFAVSLYLVRRSSQWVDRSDPRDVPPAQ